MGTRNPEVDAWFESYENPQKELVRAVRDLVLDSDPGITEAIKWQAPTFMYAGNIASFYPKSTKHVSLMFHAGASLPDPEGLLSGEGHEDLQSKQAALQGLIRAWVESKDRR